MLNTLPFRIYDWDFVLSDVDRYQIENLLWIRTSAFQDRVKSHRIEFSEVNDVELGKAILAKCESELRSGKVVETEVVSNDKSRLIIGLGSQLKSNLERRLSFESSTSFRLYSWLRSRVSRRNPAIKYQNWASSAGRQTS